MAHSNVIKAEVLTALALGATYASLTKKYGVSKSTMQSWEKSAISGQTGQQADSKDDQEKKDYRKAAYAAANQMRNEVIQKAVLDDIAKVRNETIKQLAKIAPLAIRRIEDSTLPMRRKKIAVAGGERTELDPSYSPPKVDTTGALFVLVDVLGIKPAEVVLDEKPAPTGFTIKVVDASLKSVAPIDEPPLRLPASSKSEAV